MRSAVIPDYPAGASYRDYLQKIASLQQSVDYRDYSSLASLGKTQFDSPWEFPFDHVGVFEATNTSIHSRDTITSSTDTGVTEQRLDTILSNTATEDVRTRIILIRVDLAKSRATGLRMVLYLAERYKLHPLVFQRMIYPNRPILWRCKVFDELLLRESYFKRDPLPSHRVALQLVVDAWDLMAAYVPSEKEEPATMVIWYQHLTGNRLAKFTPPKIGSSGNGFPTAEDIWASMSSGVGLPAANDNPILFFVPFLEFLVDAVDRVGHSLTTKLERGYYTLHIEPMSSQLKDFYRRIRKDFWDDHEALGRDLLKLHKLQTEVERAIAYLTDFVDKKTAPPRVCAVLTDFSSVSRRLEKVQQDISAQWEREVSILNLEESRKNITLADSVQRLTLLATFIAPLGLAASVFGMNVKELEQGPLAVWVPIVVMVVVAVVIGVALLAIHNHWRSRTMECLNEYLHPSELHREGAVWAEARNALMAEVQAMHDVC